MIGREAGFIGGGRATGIILFQFYEFEKPGREFDLTAS